MPKSKREQKVTSYELSKRLHDAGIVVESEKWYGSVPKGTMWIVGGPWGRDTFEEGDELVHLILDDFTDFSVEEKEHAMSPESAKFFPAPSTDELLAVMKAKCNEGGVSQYKNEKAKAYADVGVDGALFKAEANSPAEALALLCLHLKKEGVL